MIIILCLLCWITVYWIRMDRVISLNTSYFLQVVVSALNIHRECEGPQVGWAGRGRSLWSHLAPPARAECVSRCVPILLELHDAAHASEQLVSLTETRRVMGKTGGRDDFEWVYNDQPHTSRRKEILGKRWLQTRGNISLFNLCVRGFFFLTTAEVIRP